MVAFVIGNFAYADGGALETNSVRLGNPTWFPVHERAGRGRNDSGVMDYAEEAVGQPLIALPAF
jgi:hypothetical protein